MAWPDNLRRVVALPVDESSGEGTPRLSHQSWRRVMKTRRLLLTFFAAAAAAGMTAPALSQPWPQKPIKMIVPFAPGGWTEGIARLLGRQLSENLGQPFIMENMGGAAGTIAAGTVARAPA